MITCLILLIHPWLRARHHPFHQLQENLCFFITHYLCSLTRSIVIFFIIDLIVSSILLSHVELTSRDGVLHAKHYQMCHVSTKFLGCLSMYRETPLRRRVFVLTTFLKVYLNRSKFHLKNLIYISHGFYHKLSTYVRQVKVYLRVQSNSH